MASFPKLDETGGGEVSVERQGLADPEALHENETRRVHERVLALVALTEEAQGLLFLLRACRDEPDSRRAFEAVEKTDGCPVPGAAPQVGTGLSADMVGRPRSA